MNWESVKDVLKKLQTATLLVIVVAAFAYFINQWRLPDDAGVIRTSEGQFIFDKQELTIDPDAYFLFQRLDSTAFVTVQRDTSMELCNIVQIGTTMISLKAIAGGEMSEWSDWAIIRAADTVWCEPWPPIPPDPTPTGYVFDFNEGAGDTTRSTGMPCYGVLSSSTSWTTEGVEFNGASGIALQSIDSPSPDTLRISALVNVTSFDVYDARFISKATGTSDADHWWMVSTFSNRSVRFRLKTSSEGVTTLISDPNVLTVGQWHEIVARYDGSEMQIIVDGAVVGAVSKTGGVLRSDNVPVSIGDQPQGNRPLHGKIDKLEIK